MKSRHLILASIATASIGSSPVVFAASPLRQESQDFLAKVVDAGETMNLPSEGHGEINHCLISGNCGVSIIFSA